VNTDGTKVGGASNPVSTLLRGSLILAIVLVGVYPLFAAYGYYQYGGSGAVTAAVAGGICLLSAIVGLIALVAIPGVSGILLAMLLRMAIPLPVGLLLRAQGGFLAETNILGFIVVYYFVMLITETKLSTGLITPAPTTPSSSKAS